MATRPRSNLREQIGQLLVIGFEGTEVSPQLSSLLAEVQPAGVILFARNIVAPEQTYRLLKECQTHVSAPLLTCVDLEGGKVDRFRNAIAPSPSAADVFATNDRKLFRKHGRVIGECCRALGFTVDFAPVLDLASEASRNVMSSRAVSADPKAVIVYAREFLAGLRSAGVIGAGKHFPGLGEANLDTHHALPVVHKSWKRLWDEDMYPYRVMRREFPMVLVGHATYSDVTNDGVPASLSKKWISDVLRKKIGYGGLVVSDDLEMGGVLAAGPIEQAAVEHIRAGGDLCLICKQEDFIVRAYEALVREAERTRSFARRVAESSVKVQAFQKKSSELKRKIPTPSVARVEKLSRSLWEFGEQVRLERLRNEVL
jgi:beta-N-acetylhexosaminidase